MKIQILSIFAFTLAFSCPVFAQENSESKEVRFAQAQDSVHKQLEESLAELNQLCEQMAKETLPLSQKLSALENQLVQVRQEYQQTTRHLDSRTLELSNLRTEIKSRQDEATYLSNLLSEYIRNFESRLHIAEVQLYREALETAKLAPESSTLSEKEIFAAQADLLSVSLDRLEGMLGGVRFDGTAVDPSGLVKSGTFALLGPIAIFSSNDGMMMGTVEQRLGSLEPSVVPFHTPEHTQAAASMIAAASGVFPFDPTLGNAHKIEQTEETLLEHIQKGGPVMYPIFVLAGSAFLVAVFKWLGMMLIRRPSRKKIRALLDAIAQQDEDLITQRARAIKGPVGAMLVAGVEHLKKPRELIEEVMYEQMLSAKLKLERFLPFIAVSAASAPLLGLLGTVTGIINTFKLITVFGSGDVKTLSGGISEALITTEYGLIVAIPSLLIHALLSRRSRAIINEMEKTAVAFVNQVGRTPLNPEVEVERTEKLLPASIRTDNHQLPLKEGEFHPLAPLPERVEDVVFNEAVIQVGRTATVADAIQKIRKGEFQEEIDTIFIVDEEGHYLGYVPVHRLITRLEQDPVEDLAITNTPYVRMGAKQEEIEAMLVESNLRSLPILNEQNQLVGQVIRSSKVYRDVTGDRL